MEGKGVRQAHPCTLVEGDRMVEGLWWCGWWDTGGSGGGLVPTAAGSS